jgi:hypothetical protein
MINIRKACDVKAHITGFLLFAINIRIRVIINDLLPRKLKKSISAGPKDLMSLLSLCGFTYLFLICQQLFL